MNEIPGLNLLPESLRGWALLALAFLPYLTRAYHALATGGGLRGIWNAILFGTNTPKQPDPGAASSAATTKTTLCLALAGIILFAAACNTTPQRAAYQAAGTASVTVETALHAYDAFAAQGKTTPAQNAAVKAAYIKYQAAFAVVCDAGAVYAATGTASAAVQTAIINANNTIADLINLIRACGVKI
jgi:hypothetical protein